MSCIIGLLQFHLMPRREKLIYKQMKLQLFTLKNFMLLKSAILFLSSPPLYISCYFYLDCPSLPEKFQVFVQDSTQTP